jgi:hypothetical protein
MRNLTETIKEFGNKINFKWHQVDSKTTRFVMIHVQNAVITGPLILARRSVAGVINEQVRKTGT